jgi:hypothetical protein
MLLYQGKDGNRLFGPPQPQHADGPHPQARATDKITRAEARQKATGSMTPENPH